MLSQDSIKQFEQAAEVETREERQKLEVIEKQKRDMAKMIGQEAADFKKREEQTKQDRLKFLLKRTEIFTHFILQNNKKITS